jgi:hypothetical protein
MIYGKSLCLLHFIGSLFSQSAIFLALTGRRRGIEREKEEEVCGKRGEKKGRS